LIFFLNISINPGCKNKYKYKEKTDYFFANPEANNPQAAEISSPLDLRMDADIPEIVSSCLKNSILSKVELRFGSLFTR
jgi:hypothetical protein